MHYNSISPHKTPKKAAYCLIFAFGSGSFIEKYLSIRNEKKSVK